VELIAPHLLPKILIPMITPPLPSSCLECPLARHLDRNRFSCGNSLRKVVKSHFPATAECHDAIIEHPNKFVLPSPLPDFRGLDLEWIASHIKLTLNWLDIYPDWIIIDRENLIEVSIDKLKIGYIKKSHHQYYSDRLFGFRSLNPYEIALQMVNSHYLDGVVDRILIDRTLIPDYM
jgi:hypothetical protein